MIQNWPVFVVEFFVDFHHFEVMLEFLLGLPGLSQNDKTTV